MSLVFYTTPMSRGRILRWGLEALGEAYERDMALDDAALANAW